MTTTPSLADQFWTRAHQSHNVRVAACPLCKVTRNPDGTLSVTKPDGTVITTKRTPPSPEKQQKLTEAIERWHRNLGPVE